MMDTPVDLMIEQWTRERPDLDASSLGVVARITRLARVARENGEVLLRRHNLSDSEFHLLAAIRTSPAAPAPRDLLGPLMVTSGGLTSRIDRLERAGLVERIANPGDRRGVLLELTARGREVVDRVTTEYLANQNAVLSEALNAAERDVLADLLRKLLASLAERAAAEGEPVLPPEAAERSRQQAPAAPLPLAD